MPFLRHPSLAVACLGLGLAAGFVAHPRLIGQPAAAPPLPRELLSFSPVVKRVLPGVVSIESKGKTAAKGATSDDIDPGFGSGVLFDPAGGILTNNHVVQDAESVEITLHDGRKFTSRDIRRDPKSDLAVIKLDVKEPLPFLEFADSTTAEVGDRVLAVGAPFGLIGSVTHGIISGKSRTNLRLNPYEDWLQTDAAVNPGNSGGPLVNLDGKVLGITAAIKTRSGGFSGVGLAVASNLCRTVAGQLLKDGVVHRGYLGANVRDLDDTLAAKLGIKVNGGAIISKIHANSPAAKAGLVVGDVITSVAGKPITSSRDVQRVVSDVRIGQVAEVLLLREGQLRSAKVTIGEQPAKYGTAAATDQPPGTVIPFRAFGVAVSDVTPGLAASLNYPKDTKGAMVASVTRGGVADASGLRVGQIVVRVDQTVIDSAAAFEQALEHADRQKGVLLHILRPGGEVEFAVLKVQ